MILQLPQASISTRILGPEPITFQAYRGHPISRPDQVWEGVGDAHIWLWRRLHNVYIL